MIEAVGKDFISGYFKVIDWALKPEGVACVQAITIPEGRFEACTYSLSLSASSLVFIRSHWLMLPIMTIRLASLGTHNA